MPYGALDTVLPRGAKVRDEGLGGGGLSGGCTTRIPITGGPGNVLALCILRERIQTANPWHSRRLPYHYVEVLIHELTHNAPNDNSFIGRYYEHNEMDGAARTLGSEILISM